MASDEQVISESPGPLTPDESYFLSIQILQIPYAWIPMGVWESKRGCWVISEGLMIHRDPNRGIGGWGNIYIYTWDNPLSDVIWSI